MSGLRANQHDEMSCFVNLGKHLSRDQTTNIEPHQEFAMEIAGGEREREKLKEMVKMAIVTVESIAKMRLFNSKVEIIAWWFADIFIKLSKLIQHDKSAVSYSIIA